MLECGHSAHASCLVRSFWLDKVLCPLCRQRPQGQTADEPERGPVYPQNAPIAASGEMEAVSAVSDETTSPTIDNGPLLSMATTLVGETLVEAGTLIFINMLGSKSKEFKSMKIPISLAFVRSVLGSKLRGQRHGKGARRVDVSSQHMGNIT